MDVERRIEQLLHELEVADHDLVEAEDEGDPDAAAERRAIRARYLALMALARAQRAPRERRARHSVREHLVWVLREEAQRRRVEAAERDCDARWQAAAAAAAAAADSLADYISRLPFDDLDVLALDRLAPVVVGRAFPGPEGQRLIERYGFAFVDGADRSRFLARLVSVEAAAAVEAEWKSLFPH